MYLKRCRCSEVFLYMSCLSSWDQIFLTRLNFFDCLFSQFPSWHLSQEVLTLCCQRKKDKIERRLLRWLVGTKTNTFWQIDFWAARGRFQAPGQCVEQCLHFSESSAKKPKTDEGPVNAAHILGDSEFTVFWVIQCGSKGQDSHVGAGRKCGKKPLKTTAGWLLLPSTAQALQAMLNQRPQVKLPVPPHCFLRLHNPLLEGCFIVGMACFYP